jgi:hypothetical protein
MAEKGKRDNEWTVLERPRPLKGQTEQMRLREDTRALFKAVTQGLGNKILRRPWTVIKRGTLKAHISYSLYNRHVDMYGFAGYERVWSKIYQKGDAILADFYASEEEMNAEKGLIKTLVFSERCKGTNVWEPLRSPRVIGVTAGNITQHKRVVTRKIKSFLLADLPEGESLDLEPRRVYKNGDVRFGIDVDKGGGLILCCGYVGLTQVFPRIVNYGNEKRVYFWRSTSDWDSGAPAIKPEGHILSRKMRRRWQIVFKNAPEEWHSKREETVRYGNYLFATVGDRIHEIDWSVTTNEMPFKRLTKTVRGNRLQLGFSTDFKLGRRVFSVTREFNRRIKLVEFWPQQRDFWQDKDPMTGRFITFNKNGEENRMENGPNGWFPFWVKPEDSKETQRQFKRLIKQGMVTFNELDEILSDPHLTHRYHGLYRAIDSLDPVLKSAMAFKKYD